MRKETAMETPMSQWKVRMVRATMSSSVTIRAVNEMDTTWMNSSSKSSRAPNMMMPPESMSGRFGKVQDMSVTVT